MRLRHRRPLTYANITATLALFVALSGGAYAVTALPANSVGVEQIQTNAVTAKKIKRNAVTAAKIKRNAINSTKVVNNSLTGDDIDETTLRTVPRAIAASTATNATHATNADTATNATHATNTDRAAHATTADDATNAAHATTADNAAHASTADNATNATNASHAAAAATLDTITYKTATATAPPNDNSTAATATCDPGQHAIAGGVQLDAPSTGVMTDSYPDNAGAGWTAHVANGPAIGQPNDGQATTAHPHAQTFTVYAICIQPRPTPDTPPRRGTNHSPATLPTRRTPPVVGHPATVADVTVIPDRDLRDNIANVLRRAEAGEQFTITVAGRPVAQLGPVRHRQWASGPELAKIWDTPAPQTLADDLQHVPAALTDPFA